MTSFVASSLASSLIDLSYFAFSEALRIRLRRAAAEEVGLNTPLDSKFKGVGSDADGPVNEEEEGVIRLIGVR